MFKNNYAYLFNNIVSLWIDGGPNSVSTSKHRKLFLTIIPENFKCISDNLPPAPVIQTKNLPRLILIKTVGYVMQTLSSRHYLPDALKIDLGELYSLFSFLHLGDGYIQVLVRYVILCFNVDCQTTLYQLDLCHQEQYMSSKSILPPQPLAV